jgi:NTE family protein
MLFHSGALRRLNEFGLLGVANRFSTVSGGSIASAVLGSRWSNLSWDAAGVATNFDTVEQPIYDLAGNTIDVRSGLAAAVPFRSAADVLSRSYDRLLFGNASLQNLPDSPRFTFNSTNFSTGSLFRWSKEYGADYMTGTIFNPEVSIADIVAASSAFPPFLSPMTIRVPGTLVDHDTQEPILHPPDRLTLTDGGVYDNLALQAAESFHTVLASDGGAPLDYSASPRRNWLSQSLRTVHLIDRQVRALRRRNLVREFTTGSRLGTLWTIATPIESYPVEDRLHVSAASTRELAALPTRLAAISAANRWRLINWGYASADAAVRSYVEPSLPAPDGFPHPDHQLD